MTAAGIGVIRARDIMKTSISYIDGIATVKEAAALMGKEKTTTLVVQKRNIDDAWGLVVVQDMIRGVIIADKRSEDVHVYEIMSKPVVTVPSDMDIRYVARLMNRVGIRRVPVEDCGQLVGIVSEDDIMLHSGLF